MTKKLFFLLVICVHTCECFSQKAAALDIGDALPDRQIDVYFGDSLKRINLASFTDKLIILDFWSNRCTSCIAAFPKMDSLQKKYGKEIQIILVTKNSKQEVEKVFSRPRVKRPDLPMVIGDSLFNAWFPHRGEPFHAWVDRRGRVYAIPFDYETNDKTIAAYLSGKNIKLTRRKDFGFNFTNLLLSNENSFLFPSVTSYSLFYNSLGEYSSGDLIQTFMDSISNRPFKIHAVNVIAMKLYNVAFNNDIFGYYVDVFRFPKNNRIILNVKKPERLLVPTEESEYAAWYAHDNKLSYELAVPLDESDVLYATMQQDLNRYLKYTAKIEKRKMKCLALVRTSKVDKIAAKHRNSDSAFVVQTGVIKFQNLSVTPSVMREILYLNPAIDLPIIDETNYKGKVDLELNFDKLNDIANLKKELNKYDLDLVEKEATISVLVISDKKVPH